MKDERFDCEIAARFGQHLAEIRENDTKNDPLITLAKIIVLDHFSRNIYRSKPESLAKDDLALKLSSELVASDEWQKFSEPESQFAIMPFMHSESLQLQNRAVKLFEHLVARARPQFKEISQNALKHATLHRDIIARFNRFPHRDQILGRKSSATEIEFLEQPDSSF